MKVLSLFSGIGAFEKALDRLNIDYELVAFSEIDKYATKSYCAIHGVDESMNLGDITKVDENSLPKDIDLITYGFPCQDISLAGKQKGMFNDDGTQTRSGLFFEALRIIEATKPKIAIAENVKNLTGKKFKEQFELVLKSLEEAGYSNYWKVLNAKDYGIPQNRERVFIISIRKDIDNGYEFPEPFPLQLRLKDMLEDEVDEKFYLDSMKKYFIKHSFESEEKGNGFRFTPHVKKNANVAKTVTTRAGGRKENHGTVTAVARKVSEIELIDDTNLGFNPTPKIYTEYAPTLRASRYGLKVKECDEMNNLKIRKLTPKECYRLMGFDDEDFYKAEAVNSNAQLYKQAGNSIVVDVIEKIYEKLFEAYGDVIK